MIWQDLSIRLPGSAVPVEQPFTDESARLFEFLNFNGRWIAFLKKLSSQSNKTAQLSVNLLSLKYIHD
jgi:hypothetical protein